MIRLFVWDTAVFATLFVIALKLTGFVLFGCSANQQPVNPTTNSNTNTNTNTINQAKINEAKAKEITLGQVPNGTITEISFDYENGVLVYEVTVVEGTTEYDFEISGVDGSIISKSMDSTLD